MPYDRFRYHRGTLRLQNRDYSRPGAYFVTMRTAVHGDILGSITDHVMVLNETGKVADDCWRAIPRHHQGIRLDAWVVMPDHLHGIIILPHGIPGLHGPDVRAQCIGAQYIAPLARSQPESLIVNGLITMPLPWYPTCASRPDHGRLRAGAAGCAPTRERLCW